MGAEDRLSAHRKRKQMLASTAILIHGGSSYFALLAGIVRSILVMRWIGPTGQGVRRTVDLINKYLSNCHFGILHGTNKVLPIYLGQDDAEKVQEVEDVGVTWVVSLALIFSLGVAIAGFVNPTGHRTTAIAIIIGAGWLLVQQTYNQHRTIARSWGSFGALAIAGGIETITVFAFALLGAWKYGVVGTMVGTLLGWCAALLALHMLAPLRIHPRFDAKLAWSLARAGIPIAATIFADTLLRTVDGAIMVRYYEAYRFGLYSMAMQMAQYLYAIPEAAGFVLWPKILQAYGAAQGNSGALHRQIVLPTLVSGIYMPLLAGVAYIVLPPLVQMVVPQYAVATPATQVLSMASVFLALPMATNSLLIALNREHMVVIFRLMGAGVSAAFCYWLARHGGTLSQFAGSASIGYAVAGVTSISIVLPQYEQSLVKRIGLFSGVLLPFVWSCGALWLSYQVSTFFTQPSAGSWTWAIVRVVFFTLLMLPVLAFGNKKTGLLIEFRTMVKSWLANKVGDKTDERDAEASEGDHGA